MSRNQQNADILTAEQFAARYDVSRETLARLMAYQALLGKWQQSVNLVGPTTLDDFWQRHAADSAQILRHAPMRAKTWLDLGSGGGLPGLIVAIILAETAPEARVHLVESDRKKAAFLGVVAADLGLSARVHHARIETVSSAMPPELAKIDVITARALAPLPDLLRLLQPFANSSTIALLHKGRNWQQELTASEQYWKLIHKAHISDTDANARLLEISALAPNLG